MAVDNIKLTIVFAEHLSKRWSSYMYSFWKLYIDIMYENEWCTHKFTCANNRCINKEKDREKNKTILYYLNTDDAFSTKNLLHHVWSCWSEEAIEATKGQIVTKVHSTITHFQ